MDQNEKLKRLVERIKEARENACNRTRELDSVSHQSAQWWRGVDAGLATARSMALDELIVWEPEPQAPAPDHGELARELVEELEEVHVIIDYAYDIMLQPQREQWLDAIHKSGYSAHIRACDRNVLIAKAKAALEGKES